MTERDLYYGHPVPEDPEPQLKDWPATGKACFDERPTERQQWFVEKLVRKHGFEWRVDPRSITKGIASGLIGGLFPLESGSPQDLPAWAFSLIQKKA